MPDKETDWLDLARDINDEAESFLDSDLRSQWADNIRMYGNKHPTGSKYNTKLRSNRSKLFRPKTRSSGIKFEAAAALANFATSDIVDITAEDPTNEAQAISANLNKELLEYRLNKTIPWYQTLIGAAQEAWKMGVVVSKQSWRYEEDAYGNVVKDSPDIELIPPESLRIDSSADWRDPIGTSPYIQHIIPMYVQDVQLMSEAGENEKTGSPGWIPVTESEILNAVNSKADSLRIERGDGHEDSDAKKKNVSRYDKVMVHEYIVKEADGVDYIFYTLDNQIMLSEPVELTEVYFHGRPFVMGCILIEPFKTYPSGLPELGQPLQEEINDITNARMDNVRLVLDKRYFARAGANVDFNSLLRNVAGSITIMDRPQEDVQVISTPDITMSSYSESDRLYVEHDEMVGNFSTGSVQSNKSMNETVGGMGMLQSGAGQITEFYLRNFNETWTERVILQLIKLEEKYETLETVMAITNDASVLELYQRYGQSLPLDKILNQSLTINVNIGISSTSPQFKVERFAFAVEKVNAILASPIASSMDTKEVIKEIFGLLGYKGGARFFTPLMNGEDPTVTQLREQLQQMQQVIETKQIEQEAKMQVENAKIEVEKLKVQVSAGSAQSESKKDLADAEEKLAQAKKINVEIERMISGVTDNIELEKLRVRYQELLDNKEIFGVKDKTDRQKALLDLKKEREANAIKLEITKTNSGGGGGGVSNDIATIKPKKYGGKVKSREMGGPVSGSGDFKTQLSSIMEQLKALMASQGQQAPVAQVSTPSPAQAMPTPVIQPQMSTQQPGLPLQPVSSSEVLKNQLMPGLTNQPVQEMRPAFFDQPVAREEGGDAEQEELYRVNEVGEELFVPDNPASPPVLMKGGEKVVKFAEDGEVIPADETDKLLKASHKDTRKLPRTGADVDTSVPVLAGSSKKKISNEPIVIGKGAAVKNNNPGNLEFAKQKNATLSPDGRFALFPTALDGWNALVRDVEIKQGKASKPSVSGITGDSTLKKMLTVYATNEAGDLKHYLKNVSSTLGVGLGKKIKNIDSKKLAKAIANAESNTKVNI